MDASVAVQWVVPEPLSELSDTLLSRDDLVAPELMLIEVANVLSRKAGDHQITLEQARAGLQFVWAKVALHPVSPRVMERALELAVEISHPIYDCVYLAHAEGDAARFVTHDEELRRRASRVGLGPLLAPLPLEHGH